MFPEDTAKYSCTKRLPRHPIISLGNLQDALNTKREVEAMPMLDNRVWVLATALPSPPRVKSSKLGLRQQCYKYWLASLFIDSPTRY